MNSMVDAETQNSIINVSNENASSTLIVESVRDDTNTNQIVDKLSKKKVIKIGIGRGNGGHKRKRHHNNNKNNNKMWRKPFKFKRQMSQQQQQQNQQQQQQQQHNNNKTDIENLLNTANNKLTNCRKYSQKLSTIFKNRNRNGMAKFFLPDKRPRKELIVPPTKFLLGGNISDPLNLNSLQDEALNQSMNAATPKSSPIATSPKVQIITHNSHDPLYLLEQVDSIEYEKLLISPLKRSKNRNRKRKSRNRHESMTATAGGAAMIVVPDKESDETKTAKNEAKANELELEKQPEMPTMEPLDRERCVRDLRLDLSGESSTNTGGRKRKTSESHSCKNKVRRMDSMDKIVSPVIPQPGAWRKRPLQILPTGAPRNRHRVSSTSISEEITPTDFEHHIDENNAQEILNDDSVTGLNALSTNDGDRNEANNSSENLIINTSAATNANVNKTATNTSTLLSTYNDNKESTTQLSTVIKKDNSKYQYGNYNYHFGFNNLDESMDVRLVIFKRNAFLFKDKDILDIGCNAGQISIFIAKNLSSKSMVGIDIDSNLISKARWNLSMYVRIPKSPPKLTDDNGTTVSEIDKTTQRPQAQMSEKRRGSKSHHHHHKRGGNNNSHDKEKNDFFPMSFPRCYGGIPIQQPRSDTSPQQQPSTSEQQLHDGSDINQPSTPALFPESVYFRTMNYVPTDETQLANDTQSYDLILCLSTTKWIHLNFGDAGLKLAFKRMFNQLRPGGKLILEAQNWASYKKRKKLTQTIFNNYRSIEFFPNKFHEYLLGPEVGFSHSYLLGIPRHLNKGFRRPIQLYIKGDFTPSQVRWSDNYNPQTPYEPYRTYYADIRKPPPPMRTPYTPYANSERYRYNTPSHGLSSTSQYYNPLETDSYLPSYDTEVPNRHYCFASPLYSTVWSPPSRTGPHTPLFGSIRRVNDYDESSSRRHVYPPSGSYDGGRDSVRSIDDAGDSPHSHQHVYAISVSCSSSTREVELESNSPTQGCDNSSSPTQNYSGENSVDPDNEEKNIIDDCYANTNGIDDG